MDADNGEKYSPIMEKTIDILNNGSNIMILCSSTLPDRNELSFIENIMEN